MKVKLYSFDVAVLRARSEICMSVAGADQSNSLRAVSCSYNCQSGMFTAHTHTLTQGTCISHRFSFSPDAATTAAADLSIIMTYPPPGQLVKNLIHRKKLYVCKRGRVCALAGWDVKILQLLLSLLLYGRIGDVRRQTRQMHCAPTAMRPTAILFACGAAHPLACKSAT
jgi:hypothetical protein